MTSNNMQYLIVSCHAHQGDPLAKCVWDSAGGTQVSPSLLKKNLEEAGFKVNDNEDSHKEHGFKELKHLYRVLVLSGADIVAMGASETPEDALLHAALGYLRERDIEICGCVILPTVYLKDADKMEQPAGTPMTAEQFKKLKNHVKSQQARAKKAVTPGTAG